MSSQLEPLSSLSSLLAWLSCSTCPNEPTTPVGMSLAWLGSSGVGARLWHGFRRAGAKPPQLSSPRAGIGT